jgi:hypothetical protein
MSENLDVAMVNNQMFTRSNINYRNSNYTRLIVTDKFFDHIAGITTIPAFSVKRFSWWKDLMRSHLRTTFGLDNLIAEPREEEPIQLFDEDLNHFYDRLSIFRRRDYALYLVLDKSISSSKEIDLEKFISLSTKIHDSCALSEGYPGYSLYCSFETTIKGSHLHTRMNLAYELVTAKPSGLGKEQEFYNLFQRHRESIKSLGMDLDMLLKVVLIRGLGTIKEHHTLMVSLAAMDPNELMNLTEEDVLARFIASAEQNKRVRPNDDVALLATSANQSSRRKCYNCGRMGHFSVNCTAPKRAIQDGEKVSKKARKN